MSTTSEPNHPLIVVVAGGGPVGLTFSLHLTMMMGKHVKIFIYEGRWFVDDQGKIGWQGEKQGRTRREQVVTLQDHVIEQMPEYIQKGLFKNIDERVWPTSRNIAIREVEDRLFDLIQPFVQSGQVELIPENLNEQSERLIKGHFDILVGADGASSFVRSYCNIAMISEGIEYACGVAYHIPDLVEPADEPLHQTLNCTLTVSQTRFLVNSSTSRHGYLNLRLIQSEYTALTEDLQYLQSQNESLDLLDDEKCPKTPIWTIIRQGLDFFKIPYKYVSRVVPITINVRHASIVVRELRYEVEPTEKGTKDVEKKVYKTALAFLVGDAAMNVHFWPGRGMNSGMKAAMALARNILRTCTSNNSIHIRTPLRFLDFLDYESFMARLRAREQQGRSLRVLVDPIDKSIEASFTYAYTNHCFITYRKKLLDKLKETRDRLEERPEWPHKSRKITDEELQTAVKRISPEAVAQLTLANPWPTREMSGAEVRVEHWFPYDLKNFLPVPTITIARTTTDCTPEYRRPFESRHRSMILWIIGVTKMKNVEKLIQDIQNSEKFAASPKTTADVYTLIVIQTIEELKEWIQTNKESICKTAASLKVVSQWKIEGDQTAVDVIRAVRLEFPRVPVLVFTNEPEETQPALQFPNVTATDIEFDLKEFVGVNQEAQWNPGYRVTHKQQQEPVTPESPKLPADTEDTFVYVPDLPSNRLGDAELEQLIRHQIENIFGVNVANVKCYTRFGIGVIDATNSQLRNSLLKIEKLMLDPPDDKNIITFVDTIEFNSYIVLDAGKDDALPSVKEVADRWSQLHGGDKPLSCDILNGQFRNIYRIVSTSLDKLVVDDRNSILSIKNYRAHIYYCADCSFIEDLPLSITKEQLEEAIIDTSEQLNISSTSLRIEVNKQMNTVCVIATGAARTWSAKGYISIEKYILPIKTKLSYRLVIYPVPKELSTESIINHPEFKGTITNHMRSEDNLILELSDKDVFDYCLQQRTLHIEKNHTVRVDLYGNKNPEDNEIDSNTWYETEMLQYKPDIMRFVVQPEHPIFRYKWNAKIWLEQFKSVVSQKCNSNRSILYEPQSPISNQMLRQLRVTVMLNTLGTIRSNSYMIGNKKIKLNLNNELKTIVYDHQSKLERLGTMTLRKTPYTQTTVQLIREDCLRVYEKMVNNGQRPLLLNMANAFSPGGEYQKGSTGQEKNFFRRSDYCRSLDDGLDDFFQQTSKRLYCSSNGQLEPMHPTKKIYPIDEFGAIYTSGITVFRQSEDTGYAYMANPLKDVCAIAMAAYRTPEIKEHMLTSKYVVNTRKKIENMFAIAHQHKHDSLVLSAFGCGSCKNPPDSIARIFRSVIEQYAGFFESIVFAIIDDDNIQTGFNLEGNFISFADVLLEAMIVEPSVIMNKPNTMIGPYRILNDGLSVNEVSILDTTPCKNGAKCDEIHSLNHASQYSHPPLCIEMATNGICGLSNDPIHMISFMHPVHRSSSIKPCPDNVNCLIHYTNYDEEHNRKFSHPCRYSELCRDKEPHLTHELHLVPKCRDDKNCNKLGDPYHRAAYRHTDLADFLVPCYNQDKCQDKSQKHRIKYSHGEKVFEKGSGASTAGATNADATD